MLKLMTFVPDHYSPRVYTVANSDQMSLEKITELERSKNNQKYVIEMIPRSRGVRQSWLSSVFTTIVSILYTVPMVIKHRPDMVLSNGPGTCIPVCLVAFVLRVFYVKRIEIVYVESICRVTSMSLSGKIMYYFADRMFVQWPNLIKSYPRCLYVGRIV
ncbi:ALG14 (predicted) [Pycnogonum litorale]